MKANYTRSRSELMKIARQAAEKESSEMYAQAYQEAARDILEQITAVHLYVLAISFGFGEKRLRRFLDNCNSINDMMIQGNAFCGKEVTPDDVKEHMEKKYHLDLSLKEVIIKNRKQESEE